MPPSCRRCWPCNLPPPTPHPDAIERQLAHQEQNEIRAAYNYAKYLPERRKMMQAWADYLDRLRSRYRLPAIVSLVARFTG